MKPSSKNYSSLLGTVLDQIVAAKRLLIYNLVCHATSSKDLPTEACPGRQAHTATNKWHKLNVVDQIVVEGRHNIDLSMYLLPWGPYTRKQKGAAYVEWHRCCVVRQLPPLLSIQDQQTAVTKFWVVAWANPSRKSLKISNDPTTVPHQAIPESEIELEGFIKMYPSATNSKIWTSKSIKASR